MDEEWSMSCARAWVKCWHESNNKTWVINLKGNRVTTETLYIARLDESGIHSNDDQSSAIQMNQTDEMQPVDSSPHCDHRANAHWICMMIWIQTRNMNKRMGWIEEKLNEYKQSINYQHTGTQERGKVNFYNVAMNVTTRKVEIARARKLRDC